MNLTEQYMQNIILPKYAVKTGLDGIVHIKHVAHFGRLLADANCPENINDVLLGCYLHDIGRGHANEKQTHGDAGANIAKVILETSFSKYSIDVEKIIFAVKNHDKGMITDDLVIGSIWDADRLSLFRVKKIPDPKRLSTKVAISLLTYAENYINNNFLEY